MPASSGQQEVNRVAGLAVCFLLTLTYSLTLKIESVCCSEMLINFYQTTWRHVPEDSTLHTQSVFYPQVRDQVSHLYKMEGKIIIFVLFISWSSGPL